MLASKTVSKEEKEKAKAEKAGMLTAYKSKKELTKERHKARAEGRQKMLQERNDELRSAKTESAAALATTQSELHERRAAVSLLEGRCCEVESELESTKAGLLKVTEEKQELLREVEDYALTMAQIQVSLHRSFAP